MARFRHAVLLFALLPGSARLGAQVVQERLDLDALRRIKDEGMNRSEVMATAGYLADVIGPRPQGSAAVKQANHWTADRLRSWGLANVAVEPWGTWGRGWERVRYAANITKPYPQPLVAQPMGWSGSTKGTVKAPVVILDATDSASFQKYRGSLKGKFVLFGEPPKLQQNFYIEPWPFLAMEDPPRRSRPAWNVARRATGMPTCSANSRVRTSLP